VVKSIHQHFSWRNIWPTTFPRSWLNLYNSEKLTWPICNQKLRVRKAKSPRNRLLHRRLEILSRSLTSNLLITTTSSSICWEQEDMLSPTANGTKWKSKMT
jgi:hypothetical protein